MWNAANMRSWIQCGKIFLQDARKVYEELITCKLSEMKKYLHRHDMIILDKIVYVFIDNRKISLKTKLK